MLGMGAAVCSEMPVHTRDPIVECKIREVGIYE